MKFRELREKAGLDIKTSSKRLGIKVETLYKYENAIRHPSQEVLIKMVCVYGCSHEDVMSAYQNNKERAVEKYGKVNP